MRKELCNAIEAYCYAVKPNIVKDGIIEKDIEKALKFIKSSDSQDILTLIPYAISLNNLVIANKHEINNVENCDKFTETVFQKYS